MNGATENTLSFEPCQANDVDTVVPLMFSAGPDAYRYVFSSHYKDEVLEFLRYSYLQGKGQFGFEGHTAVKIKEQIVGIVGFWHSHNNLTYTWQAVKHMAKFYGLFEAIKVIFRGLRFEAIVPPPAKNTLCLHNLAVASHARSRGIGAEIIKYFIEEAKRQGFNKVCLDVSSENPRAKALYLSLGFKVSKLHRGNLESRYGRGCDHEAMLLSIADKTI